ncbi:DNA repair-scaffolding protein-like [Hydractinia symbiolongicarpus]|uniref:DNA repair-scaffolding protein-like n=1 Tax=Hydractinia symbiolongicarpus TaxID=13093 RepID=UPI00254CC45A|nr:DNA repair-scaffolding protein-like [Hydractinia symbiolongicarpus]
MNSKGKKRRRKRKLELTKQKDITQKGGFQEQNKFRDFAVSLQSCSYKRQQNRNEEDIDGFSSSDGGSDIDQSNYIKEEQAHFSTKNKSYFDILDCDESEKIRWSDSSIEDIQIPDEKEEESFSDEFVEENPSEISSRRHILNVSIKEYDSESEAPVEKKDRVDIDKQTSQDTIDALSPSPALQNVQSLVMSTKTEVFNNEEYEEDYENAKMQDETAKNKKKPLKGRLVERLHMLLTKEKSDLTFWKHESKRSSAEALPLQVISKDTCFSVTSVCCQSSSGMKVYLMLPLTTMKNISINTNSKLRIYPPWKKMFCRDLKTIVLLCTYHLEILSKDSVMSYSKAEEDLLAFCQKNLKFHTTSQNTSIDEQVLTALSVTDINQASPSKYSTISESVDKDGYSGRSCIYGRIQRVLIKKTSRNDSETILQKPKFFCKNFNQSKSIYVFLVQDKEHALAEVEIPECIAKGNLLWKQAVAEGEGKLCSFLNIKLVNRKSYNRNPVVLSMMKTFFPDSQSSTQQSGEASQDIQDINTQHSFIAPTCAYTFNADLQSSLNFDATPEEFIIEYLPPKILTKGDSLSNGRVSMEAKIVAVTSCNVELENVLDILDVHCRLHCFYTSSDKLVTVRKLPTCFISNCAKDLLVNDIEKDNNCVFLKDLGIRSDELIADSYTQIILKVNQPTATKINKMDDLFIKCSNHIQKFAPCISMLNLSSKVGDLVSLEGSICGVDEETTLFWNACSVCGGDEVGHDEKKNVWCKTCRAVVSSKLRMQLDVFIYMKSVSKFCILCKLLEKTITSLLAKPPDVNFEGYDVSSILNKSLSPTLCVVVDVIKQTKDDGWKVFLKEVEPLCNFVSTSV